MKFIKDRSILKELNIKPQNIIISHTSPENFPEVNRMMLLKAYVHNELNNIIDFKHEYLLIEGRHCSCYDFDDTIWEGTLYTEKELIALATSKYNSEDPFWKMVRQYFSKY